MDFATLVRQDAVFHDIVRRLLNAGEGIPLQQLADEVYGGKPASRLQALSRKLKDVEQRDWIQRVRQSDGSKRVCLTDSGRRSLDRRAAGADAFARGRAVGFLLGLTESVAFLEPRAATRSHLYMLIALRTFLRRGSVQDLNEEDLRALSAAVSALLGRRPLDAPAGSSAAGRLATLVVDVNARAWPSDDVLAWDDDAWSTLYDRCWSLRRAELPTTLWSVWGALGCTIATAFGGSRARVDQRQRLQDAVVETLDQQLSGQAPTLDRMLVRHWSAVGASTRGLCDLAERSWRENSAEAPDDVAERPLVERLVSYGITNADLVWRDHLRDVAARDLLARRKVLGLVSSGPLSLPEGQELASVLRDPWRRPSQADVRAALAGAHDPERSTGSTVHASREPAETSPRCDPPEFIERPEPVGSARDALPTEDPVADLAYGTVTRWLQDIDELHSGVREPMFTEDRVGRIDELSIHNFFSCGAVLAHVYTGETAGRLPS